MKNFLFSAENKREELTEMYKVEGPEKGIEVEEVREAMSGMKSNKAPGVSEVGIDMLRAGGEECLIWLSGREKNGRKFGSILRFC